MDQNSVKSRLRDFVRTKGIPVSKFEKACGMCNGYVSSIRQSVSPQMIQKIIAVFPDLNVSWLLTGEGNMLNTSISSNNNAQTHTTISQAGKGNVQKNFSSSDNEEAFCTRLLDEMREQRETYQSNIDRLLRIIENMQKQ